MKEQIVWRPAGFRASVVGEPAGRRCVIGPTITQDEEWYGTRGNPLVSRGTDPRPFVDVGAGLAPLTLIESLPTATLRTGLDPVRSLFETLRGAASPR